MDGECFPRVNESLLNLCVLGKPSPELAISRETCRIVLPFLCDSLETCAWSLLSRRRRHASRECSLFGERPLRSNDLQEERSEKPSRESIPQNSRRYRSSFHPYRFLPTARPSGAVCSRRRPLLRPRCRLTQLMSTHVEVVRKLPLKMPISAPYAPGFDS